MNAPEHFALGALEPKLFVLTKDRITDSYIQSLLVIEENTRNRVVALLSRHIDTPDKTQSHGNEPPLSCYLYDKQTGESNPLNNSKYEARTYVVKESPLFNCIRTSCASHLPYKILKHGIIEAALLVLTHSDKKEPSVTKYTQPLPHFIHIFNLLPQYRNITPGVLELIEIATFLNDPTARAQVIKTIELHGVYYPIWGHVSPMIAVLQTLFDHQTMSKQIGATGLLDTNSFAQVFHPFTTVNSSLFTYGIYIIYLESTLSKWLIDGDKDQEIPYYALDVVEDSDDNTSKKSRKPVLTYCPISKPQLKARITQIRRVLNHTEMVILNFNKEFIINFIVPSHKKVLSTIEECIISLSLANGRSEQKQKIFIGLQIFIAEAIQKEVLLKPMIKQFIKDARNLQKEAATRLTHAHEICILKLSGVERYYESSSEEAAAHASKEALNWFENGPFTSSSEKEDTIEAAKAHYLNKQPTSWLQMLYPITENTMPLLFENTKKSKKEQDVLDNTSMDVDSDSRCSFPSHIDTNNSNIPSNWDLGICSLSDPVLIPRPSLRVLNKKQHVKDSEYYLNRKIFYRGKIEKLFVLMETLCHDIASLLHNNPNLTPEAINKIKQTDIWIPGLREEIKTLKELVTSSSVTSIVNDSKQSLAKIESMANAKEEMIDLMWHYIYIFSVKFTEELDEMIQKNNPALSKG